MITRARATLAVAAATHFIHDGFSDVLYVLLPVWAAEFKLNFAQVGIIRTAYTGGMSLFQIPAGVLAERRGERGLLAAGTAVTACGFLVAGWTGGFAALLVVLLVAGAGSGVQHPLSSSLVSKAYETGARRAALGTYNFSGDLGKVAMPALVALGASIVGWRSASAMYGVVGIAAAVVIFILLSVLSQGAAEPATTRAASRTSSWGIRDPRGFQALAAVGMIDTATRTALLTFLPFALIAKGVSVAGVGGALALIFAGGAVGKFVCGVIAERVGVIRTVIVTEAATSIGILIVVAAPQTLALAVLLPLGIALNGTSSVLYATVADLVTVDRRSRAYGLYYTLSIGSSAMAPTVYGILSDAAGVTVTLTTTALVVLLTIPLCVALRAAVTAPASA